MDIKHHRFITAMERDFNGNLWSAGGDSFLYYWHTERIMQAMNNGRIT